LISPLGKVGSPFFVDDSPLVQVGSHVNCG
jgi:hypothetical protein